MLGCGSRCVHRRIPSACFGQPADSPIVRDRQVRPAGPHEHRLLICCLASQVRRGTVTRCTNARLLMPIRRPRSARRSGGMTAYCVDAAPIDPTACGTYEPRLTDAWKRIATGRATTPSRSWGQRPRRHEFRLLKRSGLAWLRRGQADGVFMATAPSAGEPIPRFQGKWPRFEPLGAAADKAETATSGSALSPRTASRRAAVLSVPATDRREALAAARAAIALWLEVEPDSFDLGA